ncbi:glycerophosphodiester phosphodiesterase family protein [Salipaludibacillus daqingensis]|uniref:glycerophosphodiester phosphodiesterase family protein n=1 Tax=Salipaludibacillus daqingensis TaxID=3041001 RepID=UPI0024737691|nr:glycerophosphodiester phosphodiesterase family protein [Salipaludibacillus daqingensis]
MEQTKIFAHRGYSKKYPENTMIAFEEAVKAGAEGLELDVQLTKDEKLVVMHDLTLERTTSGKGVIRTKDWNEVKDFSAGEWFGEAFSKEKIPLLSQVLDLVKGSEVTVNIEMKGLTTDRQLLASKTAEVIQSVGVSDQVIVSSFDHGSLVLMNKMFPSISTSALVFAALADPHDYLHKHQFQGLHFYFPMMQGEEIIHLMQQGLDARPYTVNDLEWMKYFFQVGCSGLITDDPVKALQERKKFEEQ